MKFQMKQVVRHERTGREYTIVGTPDRLRLEVACRPAYAYTQGEGELIWIRPQSQMEDGRFVPVDDIGLLI